MDLYRETEYGGWSSIFCSGEMEKEQMARKGRSTLASGEKGTLGLSALEEGRTDCCLGVLPLTQLLVLVPREHGVVPRGPRGRARRARRRGGPRRRPRTRRRRRPGRGEADVGARLRHAV